MTEKEREKFEHQIQEIQELRAQYFETKRCVERLFNKVERYCDKLDCLADKNNFWSRLRFSFFYQQLVKLYNELEIMKAILDMRMSKWRYAVGGLPLFDFNREPHE